MMHKTPGDARTANIQLDMRKPRLSTRQGGKTPDVRTDTRKCDSTSSSKAGYRGCCIHHCKVVAPLKRLGLALNLPPPHPYPPLQSGGPIEAHSAQSSTCSATPRIHHCKVVAPLKRCLTPVRWVGARSYPPLQSGGPIEAHRRTGVPGIRSGIHHCKVVAPLKLGVCYCWSEWRL